MDTQLKSKIEAIDVSKSFKDSPVLDHVSFEVKEGEFLSILGPSGCGKTTLLRILIGLISQDSGRIIKDGIDISNSPPAKRGMGIVFQNYALFENMTVQRNVEYALQFHGIAKKEARQKSIDALKQVGLDDHADKYPRNLSGGQQQRVAIARTLVLNPDVVLFDEPMSALDAATRLSMRSEIKKIQNDLGTTMIFVTHDQEEAFALSDRIMIVNKGAICQIDTPENIIRNPADSYVQSFVLDNLQSKFSSLSRFASREADLR